MFFQLLSIIHHPSPIKRWKIGRSTRSRKRRKADLLWLEKMFIYNWACLTHAPFFYFFKNIIIKTRTNRTKDPNQNTQNPTIN